MSGLDTPPPTDAWNRDGDPPGCDTLERRWRLWHGFMEEHAHLDAWLRSAERAVASRDWTRVTFVDDVRRFQRLRCEAASRLVQLDALNQRTRTLTPLFRGVMRSRLQAAARDCRLRWERLNVQLESVGGKLEGSLYEWEEFKEETEELAIWLAEMEADLTEVLHASGSTCNKLRQLQWFQQSMCVNSSRMNDVLERGEALIQRAGEACHADRVERRLLELLRQCAHVYGDIGRARTRFLSMRLVFEDDFLLTPRTDSGCPSETLFEEDRELPLDPKESRHHRHHHRPPSPSNEHLGLEWDPSVDVGRDLSYCAGAGERRSYPASLCSDVIGERDPVAVSHAGGRGERPAATPPEVFSDALSPAESDVRSRSPAVPSRRRAAQTDAQCLAAGDLADLAVHVPSCRGDERADPAASQLNLKSSEKRRPTQDNRTRKDKKEIYDKACQRRCLAPVRMAFKSVLLVAALSLLACLLWSFPEPLYHHGATINLHLSYVNGPPPT
ncbi:nesprin-2 [Corythoichthys intestinalis]|uniref:nesprin-2 n=1 Tax=Corythoichthys intestinalis TaxID=161448 RepID=UPI0025A5C8E1|nr:nesprin-2 [Corythoichthys intestinalis]